VTAPHPAEIDHIRAGSAADRAGLLPGDKVLCVGGRAPRDYIDYKYLSADAQISLVIRDLRDARRCLTIDKSVDEDLGIRFANDVFDGVIACRNRCGFCFVSQLPRGLRPGLYVRDDDYRLSFLHGNFVTLTNLTPEDRCRIVRLHLSPLYVSVHATEADVRRELFGCSTPNVLEEMRWLSARGIEFHTQIVVSPGVNDGVHLERTVRDLASLFPGVRSAGVVPVGLTRHRRGLPTVAPVDSELARALILAVRGWQREFRRSVGARVVFAADELYLLSGLPLPGRAHYGDLSQVGNGIGCARLFLDGVRRIRPPVLGRDLQVAMVTGGMALPLVKQLAERLEAGGTVRAAVYGVENRLLGRSVTTAGLLAGADIDCALRNRDLGDLVIIPATAVREGEGLLDGVTVGDLSRRLRVPVVAAASPAEVGAVLRRHDSRRGEK
jgi:putative radical SAM enzyme (TIGR03279 family)